MATSKGSSGQYYDTHMERIAGLERCIAVHADGNDSDVLPVSGTDVIAHCEKLSEHISDDPQDTTDTDIMDDDYADIPSLKCSLSELILRMEERHSSPPGANIPSADTPSWQSAGDNAIAILLDRAKRRGYTPTPGPNGWSAHFC
jgi:hypothetical protein